MQRAQTSTLDPKRSVSALIPSGIKCPQLPCVYCRQGPCALSQHPLVCPVWTPTGPYLLVCQRVHVANDLGGHLPCVRGTVLEGSLDDGHDEGQGWGINEVDKLGVQQGLQALLGLPGGVCQGIQQDRGDGCMSRQERGSWVQVCGVAARTPVLDGSEEKARGPLPRAP